MPWELWELCEIFFRARYSLLTMALPAFLGLMAYRSRVPGTLYSLLLLRAFKKEGPSPDRFLRDLFMVALLSFTVTGLGGVGVRLVQLHGDERFDTTPSGDETPLTPGCWQWLISAPQQDESFVAWPPLLLFAWGLAGSVLPATCAWVGLREGSLTPALQMPKRQPTVAYPVLATVKSLVTAAMLVAGLAIVAAVVRQVLWGNEDWVLPFSSWLTGGDISSQGLFGTQLLGYSPVPGYVGSNCVVHRGHLDMTLVLIFAGCFYVLEFVRDSWSGNVGTRSTGTYLLVCIGLAGVILAGTAFWFDRYGWSPLLLASILAGALYWWFRTDHYFRVDTDAEQGKALRRSRVDDQPLPDIAAAICGRTFPDGRDGKRPLFVVAAAGGGIQASAWTARVLTGLGNYPLFKKSLGLISAVSGASVGSAYFLLGAYRGEEGDRAVSGSTHAESVRTTDLAIEARINKKARQSLLEPVAWGAAFTDIPRLFTGCFPWNPLIDRGWALEQALESRFGFGKPTEGGGPPLMLRDLCQRVHPVPIPVPGPAPESSPLPPMPIPLFNATCVETGQRIIMAPVRFSDERRPFNRQRPIHFLTDYSHGSVTANPTLATAVRLSATFCYASPVARPTRPEAKTWAEQFAGDEDCQAAPASPSSSGQFTASNKAAEIKAKKELYKLHLCDGGYADNTGVVSAMDACRSIIAGFEAGADRPFDQIVLVRIDPFPKPQTSVAGTNEGFLQAVFGPVFSLLSARSATQLERADREIERCAEFARDRGIPLYSTLIRFGDRCPNGTIAKPPLSWALSARQEESIEDAWIMFTAAIDRHWAMPGCGPGKEISLGALLGPKS